MLLIQPVVSQVTEPRMEREKRSHSSGFVSCNLSSLWSYCVICPCLPTLTFLLSSHLCWRLLPCRVFMDRRNRLEKRAIGLVTLMKSLVF